MERVQCLPNLVSTRHWTPGWPGVEGLNRAPFLSKAQNQPPGAESWVMVDKSGETEEERVLLCRHLSLGASAGGQFNGAALKMNAC